MAKQEVKKAHQMPPPKVAEIISIIHRSVVR